MGLPVLHVQRVTYYTHIGQTFIKAFVSLIWPKFFDNIFNR